MSLPLTRRRFIKIAAAQSAALLAPSPLHSSPLTTHHSHWRGIVLGAEASIQLSHEDPTVANQLLKRCVSEIQRLESIFSLYDNRSALCRLNHNGLLLNPPAELTSILRTAQYYGDKSNGAFDVTIHPIVEALRLGHPTPSLSLIDYRQIKITQSQITLQHPGAAITLNGIAQGYITDAIADLLASEGITNTLIELGEKRALGNHPEGRPWTIGLANPANPTQITDTIELTNRALSSSGGYGTPFDSTGKIHHLIDPRTGKSANHHAAVHVESNQATEADALSTALAICTKQEAMQIFPQFPQAKATFVSQ